MTSCLTQNGSQCSSHGLQGHRGPSTTSLISCPSSFDCSHDSVAPLVFFTNFKHVKNAPFEKLGANFSLCVECFFPDICVVHTNAQLVPYQGSLPTASWIRFRSYSSSSFFPLNLTPNIITTCCYTYFPCA